MEIERIKVNKKEETIASKKIKCVLKYFAPYAAALGITASIASLTGHTPFIQDKYKEYLNVKTVKDSIGNETRDSKYGKYDNDKSVIRYIGKYEKQSDGTYKRLVKTYSASEVARVAIDNLLKDEDINNIDFVLGSPISSRYEVVNELDKGELNGEYLEAVLYDTDKNEYIYIKENQAMNAATSLMWILCSVFPIYGIYYYRYLTYKETLNEQLRNIEKEYRLTK